MDIDQLIERKERAYAKVDEVADGHSHEEMADMYYAAFSIVDDALADAIQALLAIKKVVNNG